MTERVMKREATWEESVAEYKGYLKDIISGKDVDPIQMSKFKNIYHNLKSQK